MIVTCIATGLLLAANPPAPASKAQGATAAVSPVSPTPSLVGPMSKLGFTHGIWVGPASGVNRDGSRFSVTQTERIGPMLGGDIVVIEGRGYEQNGKTAFNAFAVISWNPQSEKYEFRSYAQGRAGTFELKLTADGYVWEVPAGPGAIVRYTATVKDGVWHEVGDYVAPGKPPARTFEMTLKRVGDTDWPLGTPVSPAAG